MTSLANYHLPSLILIISFLLYSTNGDSLKSLNPSCPSFDCGNGIKIGYPFWHQSQQIEHCGYPGFNLSCNDQNPVLHLSNNHNYNSYAIKKINYSNKTLILTYTGLKEAACPKLPHNFSLNTTTLPSFFNYTFGNKIMHYFYNCTLYPPSLPHIECLQYGAKRSYVFNEGAVPEFDWHRYCQSTVIVPILDEAVNGDSVQALQEGFKLTWNQPTDGKCQTCEASASGGFCGYNNGLHNFFCVCSNGRQSINCHHNATSSAEKGGVTAEEPNYVAVGAVLLGGLVIIATVFFFIQKKKKVDSYRPV